MIVVVQHAIEFPEGWHVSSRQDDSGTVLAASDGSGRTTWEVRRLLEPVALLALSQRRMEEMQSSVAQSVDNVALVVDISSPAPMAVLRYRESDRSIVEYLIVRAPLGHEGIGYSLRSTLRGPADGSIPSGEHQRVLRSFTLLGLNLEVLAE